jgi:hypothetical protein
MGIGSVIEPRSALPQTLEAPISASPSAPRDSAAGPSPFARLVQRLGSEVQSGETLVRSALTANGGSLGPAELIALQAGVYRYDESVDLAAKLVDHATSSVKTVLQGQ